MIILLSLNEEKVGGSNSISRFLNKYFIVSKIIYIVQSPNLRGKKEGGMYSGLYIQQRAGNCEGTLDRGAQLNAPRKEAGDELLFVLK